MAKTNEKDYLRKAVQGDEVSFLYLYDLWVDKVFLFCYLQTQDPDAAEEICLSVFRNAWTGLDNFRQEAGPFCTWLFAIARAELVTQTTSRNGHKAPRPQLSPRQDTSRYQPMLEKLAQLPRLWREALILKLVTGFSTPEICQTLKISPEELMHIQTHGLTRMSGLPENGAGLGPLESAQSKLNYMRSRLDVLQAQIFEMDDDAFDRHVIHLGELEARWEDFTERARHLEGASPSQWAELDHALDEVLVDVGQEAAAARTISV